MGEREPAKKVWGTPSHAIASPHAKTATVNLPGFHLGIRNGEGGPGFDDEDIWPAYAGGVGGWDRGGDPEGTR
jgi:hypothetical protein